MRLSVPMDPPISTYISPIGFQNLIWENEQLFPSNYIFLLQVLFLFGIRNTDNESSFICVRQQTTSHIKLMPSRYSIVIGEITSRPHFPLAYLNSVNIPGLKMMSVFLGKYSTMAGEFPEYPIYCGIYPTKRKIYSCCVR